MEGIIIKITCVDGMFIYILKIDEVLNETTKKKENRNGSQNGQRVRNIYICRVITANQFCGSEHIRSTITITWQTIQLFRITPTGQDIGSPRISNRAFICTEHTHTHTHDHKHIDMINGGMSFLELMMSGRLSSSTAV